MNCENAERRIQEAVDGELTLTGRKQLDLHLGSCSECRRKLEHYRALRELSSDWLAHTAAHGDPGTAMNERVFAAIAARQPSRPTVSATTGMVVFAAASLILCTVTPCLIHPLPAWTPILPAVPLDIGSALSGTANAVSGLLRDSFESTSPLPEALQRWTIPGIVVAVAVNFALFQVKRRVPVSSA